MVSLLYLRDGLPFWALGPDIGLGCGERYLRLQAAIAGATSATRGHWARQMELFAPLLFVHPLCRHWSSLSRGNCYTWVPAVGTCTYCASLSVDRNHLFVQSGAQKVVLVPLAEVFSLVRAFATPRYQAQDFFSGRAWAVLLTSGQWRCLLM